ncbi:hypothetical protein [Burkholderia latens]|uniref:hypothetical protein n=1 Tax=Burkholderia latens TaxID=488446 RepID=UPI0014783E14|nr:hypothetical protein [Burkholderia latens]
MKPIAMRRVRFHCGIAVTHTPRIRRHPATARQPGERPAGVAASRRIALHD